MLILAQGEGALPAFGNAELVAGAGGFLGMSFNQRFMLKKPWVFMAHSWVKYGQISSINDDLGGISWGVQDDEQELSAVYSGRSFFGSAARSTIL